MRTSWRRPPLVERQHGGGAPDAGLTGAGAASRRLDLESGTVRPCADQPRRGHPETRRRPRFAEPAPTRPSSARPRARSLHRTPLGAVALLACPAALLAACDGERPSGAQAHAGAACVALQACDLWSYGRMSIRECTGAIAAGVYDLRAASIECLAAAGPDCDAAAACLGRRRLESGECDTCLGDSVVRCDGTGTYAYDCNHDGLGHVCSIGSGLARCSHPVCTADGGGCGGGGIATCRDGYLSVAPCGEGAVCEVLDGISRCVGTGDACMFSRCEGNVLIDCQSGRQGVRTDCGQFGGTCRNSEMYASCEPPESECDADLSTCDGDTMLYCGLWGRVARFDCGAHGYGGCLVDSEGWARCFVPGG